MNNVNNADLNIRRYAAAGKKYGAIGLLNTDWGDWGHYNMLAGSLHGIALGGAMGWNTEAPAAEDFDRIWNTQTFADPDGKAIASIRAQTFGGFNHGTWVSFQRDWSDTKILESVPDADSRQMIDTATKGAALFAEYRAKNQGEPWIAEELEHASRMNALLGEKLLLLRAVTENGGKKNPELAKRLRAFADDAEKLGAAYEALWLARSKESELGDIRNRFRAVVSQAREIASKIG